MATLSTLLLWALGMPLAREAAAKSLALGRAFTYVVDPRDGKAYAMGENDYGQLGVSDRVDHSERMEVLLPAGAMVTDLAAGAFHGLFLTDAGTVYGTGRNDYGQLTASTTAAGNATPTQIMTGVKAVAAGYAHSLFLLEDGSVMAAGLNNAGQLGNGGLTNSMEPVAVQLAVNETVAAVVAGYDFSYFLTEAGNVYAVGQNLGGQLGDGTRDSKTTPVKVPLEAVTGMAAGDVHGLFLTTSGTVMATGANFDMQLGLNESGNFVDTPTMTPLAGIEAVAAGGASSCALPGSGTPTCMGSNRKGELGLGQEVMRSLGAVVDVAGTQEVALGETHTFFRTGSAFQATGSNADGELGDGTTEQKFVPIEVFSYASTTATETATLTPGTFTETSTIEGTVTKTGTVSMTDPAVSSSMLPGVTFTNTAQTTTSTQMRGSSGLPFELTAGNLVVFAIIAVLFLGLLCVLVKMCPRHEPTGHPELLRAGSRGEVTELVNNP